MTTLVGADDPIFVGVDIGTTKVCVLVGHMDPERRLRVIGVGSVPSQGMRKGGVVSMEGVAQAVASAKDKAERTSGFEIASALVSLSGAQAGIHTDTRHGKARIARLDPRRIQVG